jgi:hypothetical protein
MTPPDQHRRDLGDGESPGERSERVVDENDSSSEDVCSLGSRRRLD